jgi:hypothetical protein
MTRLDKEIEIGSEMLRCLVCKRAATVLYTYTEGAAAAHGEVGAGVHKGASHPPLWLCDAAPHGAAATAPAERVLPLLVETFARSSRA